MISSLILGFIGSFAESCIGAILGAIAFAEKDEKHRKNLKKMLSIPLGAIALLILVLAF